MALMELNREPSAVFLPRRTRFVVGVDLGQSADPTAIAVLEYAAGVIDTGSDYERHIGQTEHLQSDAERIDVRHLERLPLGLSIRPKCNTSATCCSVNRCIVAAPI